MSVLRSIVLTASVALVIAFALFVGHGIAVRHMMPIIWGLAFLVGGVALVFLQIRSDGKRAR